MKDKLRLLLWPDCGKSCPGCCNKDWDLKTLPIATNLIFYREIILTGGEPMLYPDLLQRVIGEIQATTHSPKIYLYTANTKEYDKLINIMSGINGVTVTLHDDEDVTDFIKLVEEMNKISAINSHWLDDKSLRLHVFEDVDASAIEGINLPDVWNVKGHIKWIENCPLPNDEEFKRYWLS
jgi:hypothetical protein